MRNQTSFRLTTTLLPTDTTAKTTTVINKVDADGNQFYPTFTNETVVITNDDKTIMETTRASCTNWVLTFSKRGLSDDVSETTVANRKLTWNPWSLCFVTVGASDIVNLHNDNSWAGDQTFQWKLITEKWIEYPSFENITALEAYGSPFAWMFAIVEDTWELYRYNAVTEQWDMLSTTELSDFIIRESETAPDESTADNIVTIVDTNKEIYLWPTIVSNYNSGQCYVDVMLVWWGWGWGAGCNTTSCKGLSGSWGWGWGYVECIKYPMVSKRAIAKVWAWGAGGTAQWCPWCNWGDSVFSNLIAYGWWGWWGCENLCGDRSWGNLGWYSRVADSVKNMGWHRWGTTVRSWWWGAWWDGNSVYAYLTGSTCGAIWGQWWPWIYTNFGGSYDCYAWWWGWGWNGGGNWGCWMSGGGNWWANWTYKACSATKYGSGGWGWYWYCWSETCVYCGWDGCKWVVIVRYPTDWSYWFTCATWGTKTSACINGVCYNIHTFTSTNNTSFCIEW